MIIDWKATTKIQNKQQKAVTLKTYFALVDITFNFGDNYCLDGRVERKCVVLVGVRGEDSYECEMPYQKHIAVRRNSFVFHI